MAFVRSGLALALGLVVSMSAQAQDQAQVKRGEYLARAADCMACHTAEGGAPYAGGLPIHSPFGTIYGSNITPDKRTASATTRPTSSSLPSPKASARTVPTCTRPCLTPRTT